MTFGEIFVVTFITIAVLSASWWVKAIEKLWISFTRASDDDKKPPRVD